MKDHKAEFLIGFTEKEINVVIHALDVASYYGRMHFLDADKKVLDVVIGSIKKRLKGKL